LRVLLLFVLAVAVRDLLLATGRHVEKSEKR
jgi:hypothetical protein